ncbi:MAG: hypothetical protein A2156_07290 [Deltaproteobacteria bacterium RBG_16_48_10]|nr:MAG: hypothetical protein A2156_07290 [Deltaproteobacteria bacterium RBG_16_48_10]
MGRKGYKGTVLMGIMRAMFLNQIQRVKHLTPRILGPLSTSGMTLIEFILTLVIIGILSAVAIPRFDVAFSSMTSVNGAAFMIASDIRYAQECAMANRVSKTVRFVAGQSAYTFDATIPPTSSLDPSGQLPGGVTIGTTITFTFNSLGEPTAGGGSSVTVSGGGQNKTISVVNYTGKVNIS